MCLSIFVKQYSIRRCTLYNTTIPSTLCCTDFPLYFTEYTIYIYVYQVFSNSNCKHISNNGTKQLKMYAPHLISQFNYRYNSRFGSTHPPHYTNTYNKITSE